jgi:two-component system, cell cycle sensor histidine kinase and response regulator CckA
MKNQETILVVEDELSLRKLISFALKDNGYRVMHANNGQDALEMARHHPGPIHLLVTDYILLGPMDGLELAQALKRRRQDMAVLCTSGYEVDQSWALRESPPEDHPDRFLQKPFSPKELLRSVQSCLGTRAAA